MAKNPDNLDLETMREFFKPHPGGPGGALMLLPAELKRVVDELAGKTMTLREALARIEAVTNGEVEVCDSGYIDVTIKEDSRRVHAFCIIWFKFT